jgi:hypothetical protein
MTAREKKAMGAERLLPDYFFGLALLELRIAGSRALFETGVTIRGVVAAGLAHHVRTVARVYTPFVLFSALVRGRREHHHHPAGERENCHTYFAFHSATLAKFRHTSSKRISSRQPRQLTDQQLRILALKRYRKRVQFRGHQSRDDRGIALHECSRGGFIRCFENCNAECFVARFLCAARQDQFAFFNRVPESPEMPRDHHLILFRPGRVGMQPRHEPQNVDELLWLGVRFGLLR